MKHANKRNKEGNGTGRSVDVNSRVCGFVGSAHSSFMPVVPASGAHQPLGSTDGSRHEIDRMGGPGGPLPDRPTDRQRQTERDRTGMGRTQTHTERQAQKRRAR